MFQTLLLFLGYPAKKYVAGDVHAAQASSPHRVSNGPRRTRQLPKAKTRLSGGTGAARLADVARRGSRRTAMAGAEIEQSIRGARSGPGEFRDSSTLYD